MVLNKKPIERNRNILVQKGRKLSRKQEYNHLDIQETPLETKVAEEGRREHEDSVSMESMVCLHDADAKVWFGTAIHQLRTSRFREALKLFQDVTKYVQGLAGYGEYMIYKRTQNKKTTLSALHMFQALAYEGLCNPRKAIESCNSSIAEDPGWPIPFSKRSDYFSCFEQFLLDTDGATSEEAQRCRARANIIVNPQGSKDDKHFNDLQEALNAANDGDEIFIEKGFYYREEGYNVTSGCSLIGASSRGCIIVSKGNPTFQIFGGKRTKGSGIVMTRLQFRNKIDVLPESDADVEIMKSSASHIFIISPESITIRDCLFVGGSEESGGILVAEEAFYQSLLELEFQNPEILQGSDQVADISLRLLINNCIFSDIKLNSPIFSNSQSTVILSNSVLYNCSTGIKAQEGSTVNLFNSEIRNCSQNGIDTDSSSTLNIRGGYIYGSGSGEGKHFAGLVLRGNTKANIAKSLFRQHRSAIICSDSDLIFESNCVMDIGEEVQTGNLEDKGLQVQDGAICLRLKGNCYIRGNNFHNCSLVFLAQNGAEPTISENNIETCLIGIISASASAPKLTKNIFQCMLMSIGIFIEGSRGTVSSNVFRYVANGLDIYRSSAPTVLENTFTSLAFPGLGGSLVYDIHKVKSGKVEDMESSDIITFNSKTSQSETNVLVQNRFSTMERTRVCSNCRLQRLCAVKCGTCEQIYYCSETCQVHDRKRHSNFCSLSLKDML